MKSRTDAGGLPVTTAIAEARAQLIRAGVPPDDAAFDAEVLARSILGWDRAALVTRGLDHAPLSFADRYRAAVDRRAAREPVAFITGTREFWGLDFDVTPDVLIPRPETELLVEQALTRASPSGSCRRVADVGTGSGCVAIALARELPDTALVATDCSSRALAVAARNAARHGVADRIRLIETDLLDGVDDGPFDVIVSNPPYVALTDAPELQPEVGRFEPAGALFGGDDGLDVIRRLSRAAGRWLTPGGVLLMEIGMGQGGAVRAIARQDGWAPIGLVADLAGIPRVAVLSRTA